MENIKLITNADELNKEIKLIGTAGKKLDQRIHTAACSCILQADKNNNADPALRLVEAMPKSSRKNALIEWFTTFGQFKWNAEKKVLKYDSKGTNSLDSAVSMPFWEFKPEPEFKPFELSKALQSLLKKADAALEDDEHKGQHKVLPAQVAELRKLLANIS